MHHNTLRIFLSPLFLLGLFLLLINDFFLKAEFHNVLTGKLSDFAGLFIFPLFWAAFFPKRKLEIYISTAVFFFFWKSTFSQVLIDVWNSVGILRINRVVDFTDLTALLVLPVSYLCLSAKLSQIEKPHNFYFKKVFASTIILMSVFAFAATSSEQDRSIGFVNKYELTITFDEFKNRLNTINSNSELKIEVTDKYYPPDKTPDIIPPSNYYHLWFYIKADYCETSDLRVFSTFFVEKEKILIDSVMIDYSCKTPPTESDRQNLIKIFEREFIEKLRQNNTQ